MNTIRTAFCSWLDRHVPLAAGELSTMDLLDGGREGETREKAAA